MTLGSHQQTVGKSQTYITPRWLLDALRPFDLDPCAADPRPWDCAETNWSTDGLSSRPWFGRVFLNPPFDRYQVELWVNRLARHGNGVALLHARTEAAWFKPIWTHATAILFLASRIKFCDEEGIEHPANSGAPAILAGFGENGLEKIKACKIPGYLVTNWMSR